MKESRLLRFLDRYVGSFLCFVLSLFRRTRPYKTSPQKVLLIELFEMGASIMIIPSIQHLRAQRQDVEIYVLTTAGNSASWEISGLIKKENILCINGRTLSSFLNSATTLVFALRRIGIDLVVDFEKFSRISTILSVFAGVRRIAGFYRYEYEGLYRGSNLIDIPCAFNQNLHIAQNFLALTKTALRPELEYPNFKGSIDPKDLMLPRYAANSERMHHLHKQLELTSTDRLVLIYPDVGSNLRVRNYPVESYAKVAHMLLEDSNDFHIAILGMNENWSICSELEALIGSPRCHNLCGTTKSLHDLMDLFSISELLIGNDNGPLHFASLTPIRMIGIFSTDSPFMYGPLGESVVYSFFHCSPCISALNHKHSRCQDNVCIKAIPPSFVAEMALQLLAGEVETRTINGTQPYLVGNNPIRSAEPLVQIKGSKRQQSVRREDPLSSVAPI